MSYIGDIVGSADRAARCLEFTRSRTVDATAEPVSLAEIRAHAVIDADMLADDDLLQFYVRSARTWLENFTGMSFMPQTWRFRCDSFPAGDSIIYLPRPPLRSIESLEYIDQDGETQELEEDVDFRVDLDSRPARLVPTYGNCWPATRDEIQAVTIVAVCGYEDATKVPHELKLAVRLLAAYWYARREAAEYLQGADVREIPMGVQSLVSAYRMRRFS